MVAQDDVDLEGLQAQIDLSMSFAHNLVTSWIRPTHFTQLSSNGTNAAQLLEAELRRPPRLGVGAPIPTGSSLVQEASKLKRRLEKHSAKNEGDMSQSQDPLKSDEEEHKGRPAKRKIKVDPFKHECSKKKKGSNPETNPSSPAEDVSKYSVSLLRNKSTGESQNHSSFSRKEKRRMNQGYQQPCVNEGEQSATFSPPMKPFTQTTSTLTSISGQSGETSVSGSPERATTTDSIRFRPNYFPLGDKDKLLGISLLNLGGPPESADSPGNTSQLHNSRKKRKRRKKKKIKMNNGTDDNPR